MTRTYFYPHDGRLVLTQTPTMRLKNKIDSLCLISTDQTEVYRDTKEVEYFPMHHGYIDGDEVYNNEGYLVRKSYETYEKSLEKDKQELDKFEHKINVAYDLLSKMFNRIAKYRKVKGSVKKLKTMLEKGYVKTDVRLRGSKRGRRFYKNSDIRYLTQKEIDKYTKQFNEEKEQLPTLKEEIKAYKTIEDMFFTLGCTPKEYQKKAIEMNNKTSDFGRTIYAFNILKDKIGLLDEEIYMEALGKYMEVLKIDREEKNTRSDTNKHRTTVFIDENGIEIKN